MRRPSVFLQRGEQFFERCHRFHATARIGAIHEDAQFGPVFRCLRQPLGQRNYLFACKVGKVSADDLFALVLNDGDPFVHIVFSFPLSVDVRGPD